VTAAKSVWQYFEKLNEKGMKCKICKVELSYIGCTGAVLKGRHPETQPSAGSSARRDGVRITVLIREMIAVDMQLLSMVEDV
jgi:hypothetical protein